jgi:hypothetical protein
MSSITRPVRHAFVALLCALAGAAPLAAHAGDEDTIATDRPDFVESSNVVGKSRFQVETSIGMDRNKAGSVRERSWSTPTLLRFGISDNVELRLETDGAMRQRVSDSTTGVRLSERGYGDVSLGLKWHVLDAAGNLPSVGVLFHADMETGSPPFRGEGTRPSARMVAEWELGNDLSLGVMPGMGYERHAGGTFGILGVVLGKAWNDQLRSFVELSSPRIDSNADGGTEASATVGVAYLISNNCQIDSALSRGLKHRTPDLSVTVGLSFKL